MSLKFVLLVSVIAVVAAIEIHQSHEVEHQEHHGPVEYEFSYSVHDEHTGDIKAQKETRKDDRVEGSYELIDSDGYRRLVHYKSDKHNGFEAIVHREPTNIKIPIPEHREKLVATKILAHHPIVHYAHAQPQIHNHLIRSEPRSIHLGKADVSYGTHVSYSGPGVSYHY